ncbi:MAG: hybrid sensor histidine kinase/response regulator [Prolixibacteraceae bacterium]|jgi:two-component system, sensor histidine kinase and response regulator|nr:hybrid sensor histidine kinase/response regulator [Prolixibacteraceae bacterium]MBT6767337.1 hybrid sensor histidine kinase/response regulator [Prolixibacteraceae bacterium]MBT6998331.1 hybrid sensor histidine kinase/response regulator [Prolixibacteraceae bacterium]MBT7397074.1 hybrid sensor histidine kinase/response regulator [Prolixibacteraceae bacterium]
MGKKVILCIDDEEIILQALEEQLNNIFGEEYEIETSDSGEDALEYFKELIDEGINVPVVISDYIMPGMKGDELLKEIHALSPGSLKILLTGQANIEGISNAINNAQLYRYIEKPWDKDDLVLTVREAIKSFLQEIKIIKQNKELLVLNASLEEKVIQRTKELSVANASKDKFFSIIAHDLKSPFNAIFGLTEIMIENWADLPDEDKIDFIKDLNSTSKNTYNLLQNLLEWSRAQTGNIQVEPSRFLPFGIVDENIKVLMKNAEIKSISIINNIPEDITCYADKNMISTVFRNLISNSTKFTNNGGSIEISATSSNSFHQFCISDNGIGMDQKTVEKLFILTEKVQRSGTNNEQGTGLGLILCKEFIEKNGGEIFVESEPNKGSKFFFTIPKS